MICLAMSTVALPQAGHRPGPRLNQPDADVLLRGQLYATEFAAQALLLNFSARSSHNKGILHVQGGAPAAAAAWFVGALAC